MADDGLTEQQRKWMASVRASLQNSTGRSMAEWVEIARACPETKHRARLNWFKQTHGLGQNYASVVMHELEKEGGGNSRDPDTLAAALWANPSAAAIFKALQAAIDALPQTVTGQRKTYTTWSRSYAYAAVRPTRDGSVRLGLAVAPETSPQLESAAKEGWSERLKSTVVLTAPEQVDANLRTLLRTAWESS